MLLTFLAAWWLLDALRHPVRGRTADFATLLTIGVTSMAALTAQFLGVLQQAEIITGHEFLTHEGRRKACSTRWCSTPATSTTSRFRTS